MTQHFGRGRDSLADIVTDRRFLVRLLSWLVVLIPAAWGAAHAVAESLSLLF
ncbi:MAG: hypothetical protein O2973_10635 [Gemmatimonadetes bacterium]|nr:hypothetical protein [Gemmatimonadota bacterium]